MSQTIRRGRTKESVALAAFFKIADQWELTTQEQMKLLGMTSESTFYSYKQAPENARIDKDKLERLSYVLGIYKDLQTLLPDEESARKWIKKPNSIEPFGGRSVLDYLMKQGRILDLYRVRQYLAGQRGV
jgi:uncharacterized protein (DUF2384 family)